MQHKKIKFEQQPISHSAVITLSSNPFKLKPQGCQMLHPQGNRRRVEGLGALSVLEDELILGILSGLDVFSLGRCARVSKAFMVFSCCNELWKEHVLEEFGGNFVMDSSGSWKQTLINMNSKTQPQKYSPVQISPIQVPDLFSDALYNRLYVSHLNVAQQPEWMRDNVIRKKNLSQQVFEEQFLKKNYPVLIEDVVEKWPAFKAWNKQDLLKKYKTHLCKTNGGVEMKLEDYLTYAAHTCEANPIYLFDNEFTERLPGTENEYSVPDYFSEDFFALLEGEDRPSFRWILIGPTRSGSGFHKDPNYTSAWNGLISGKKKWVMYPPDSEIPGVHPSEDGWVVETPDSIVEWFSDFYVPNSKAIEVIQKPGDLLFIPSGWWHCALNLEETIAVTQNVVNRYNWPQVSKFLQSKSDQTLWNNLKEKMKTKYPDLLELAEQQKKNEPAPSDEKVPFMFNFMVDESNSAQFE